VATFLDLQDRVIAEMRLDSTADRTRVKQWINDYYKLVSSTTGYHETRGVTTLTAGQASYVLPSTVHTIRSMAVKRTGQTEAEAPLELVSVDEILRRRQGTPSFQAWPTHYAFLPKNVVELWPTPDDAHTLVVYFEKLPADLSADGDAPDLPEPYATFLLTTGATIQAASFLRLDPTPQRQVFEFWLSRFRAYLKDRAGWQTTILRFADEGPELLPKSLPVPVSFTQD